MFSLLLKELIFEFLFTEITDLTRRSFHNVSLRGFNAYCCTFERPVRSFSVYLFIYLLIYLRHKMSSFVFLIYKIFLFMTDMLRSIYFVYLILYEEPTYRPIST